MNVAIKIMAGSSAKSADLHFPLKSHMQKTSGHVLNAEEKFLKMTGSASIAVRKFLQILKNASTVGILFYQQINSVPIAEKS